MTQMSARAEILQERFGLQVAARLAEASNDLPYDITERLRAARTQALARRRVARVQLANPVLAMGRLAVLGRGEDALGPWGWLASALPLLALVVGLVVINNVQNDDRADEVAEVDSALLTDDLPPAAYVDAGFIQFLRIGQASAP